MILEGTTSDGAVVPVQVTADGKVVAEGRTGPEGPQGPQGPEGPQGPPGPDSPTWDRNGTVLSPTNAGDSVRIDDGSLQMFFGGGGPSVDLQSGAFGVPLVRSGVSGHLLVGVSIELSQDAGALIQAYGTDGSKFVGSRAQNNPQDGALITSLQGVSQSGATFVEAGSVSVVADGATSIGDHPGRLVFSTTPNGSDTPAERARLSSTGVFTLGDGTTNAVTLDPGSTGVPLVRDSVGRLLVGLNNAPAGTLAGDVVCQGAVVLQSPNGTWFALEVEDNGTLSISQTAVR